MNNCKYTLEEIKAWLCEEYDYPSNDIDATAEELYNISEEGLPILYHLIETRELSACGNPNFNIEILRSQFPECTNPALIIIYDGLYVNGGLNALLSSRQEDSK